MLVEVGAKRLHVPLFVDFLLQTQEKLDALYKTVVVLYILGDGLWSRHLDVVSSTERMTL